MIARAGHMLLMMVLIIVSGVRTQAQSFNPNYNFKHLNVQSGLTQNIVYHFLQDSRGYMWIGTHNGLSLYDGVKVINYLHSDQDSTSISGNFISSILEDSSQQIWVGNEKGIDLYDRSKNAFVHFGVDRRDGTKDDTYCVLLGFVSANELWFLDTKTRSVRALNLKQKKTSFVSEFNTYHAALYKGSGDIVNIWSAYDKGTIHQAYRKNKLIEQQTYFSGKSGLFNDLELVVSHVFQQNDTVVWLSTNEGLVKLNPTTNQYQILKTWQKEVVKELRYSALSPSGQLWVATGPSGVFVFDIKTNQFVGNFRNNKLDPFSVCSDNIVTLYFDRMGNVWVGSYGEGSSYVNIKNTFFTDHISKNETQTWNSDNSISWLGMDAHKNLWCLLSSAPGLWILDREFKIGTHQNPLLENGATYNGSLYKILFDKNNNVWCATAKGLYRYDVSANRIYPVKYELLSDEVQGSIWIKDIISLNDGSIIFSTYVGLYHLTNESGKPVVKPIHFLKPGAYTGFGALFQDDHDLIYIKTLGDSLYILKPAVEGRGFDLVSSIRFMPQVNQYYTEKTDSVVYLATTDGLYHFDKNHFGIRRADINNKLPFLNVSSVLKKDQNFWVFGEKGLYFFDEKSGLGRAFTVEDGLPANEFIPSAVVMDTDQRCIAGTTNGLVSFLPWQLRDSTYPPLPQLTGIYINDVLHTSGPNSNEIKNLDLSFRRNTFSFDFSSIAFQHPSDCRYEYKLEGYDEDWIKSGNAHYTRYSKLPPGSYTFHLRVIDPWGRVSPFNKTLQIEIGRAFWQTTFFKVAALLFLLSVGWLLSRWYFTYRIRKQKREFERQQLIEKERTRIATDMHDDLGAGLSRIRFLTQSILNKKINDDAISTELKKITSFSDEMSEKMGEIVWALNEKNDTLADLVAYTRSYAVEYLANHNIECEANTPMNLPGTFITGEMRRNIFLSVKECLHNVVKHAEATKVCLTVELNNVMQIVIHDNGKGIDWNNRRSFSNGLENIKKRMNEINGKVSYSNELGAKVSLTIPFV
jgi:signal transduction histidine kinase/ligand-binding sensor domain-containing protein